VLTVGEPLEPTGHRAMSFPTTRWSLVLHAGHRDDPEARDALGLLCQAYWYPIYALIRRQGYTSNDAENLTQEYFARLLEKGVVAAADPCKGRFRAYLSTDCRHFLLDQGRRERVRVRIRRTVSIDGDEGERRYQFEPCDEMTPERLFDRTWAMTLLDRVLERLARDYASKGQGETFEGLKVVLTQGKGVIPAADLAARLGMRENAVHQAVHRLKKRYRALLETEIAATLDDPSELEDEIRSLFDAVRP
jgi:RNA polymerase sigma-70 factor (ECF subfamily)